MDEPTACSTEVSNPSGQRVHPLHTFDSPLCRRVFPYDPKQDKNAPRWLLSKRLAGHATKLTWERATELISGAEQGTDGERGALHSFFTELDGLELNSVMCAMGVTPRRMAELFIDLGVGQWQAVLWVNQFSSRPATAATKYWDSVCLGSLRFDENNRLLPRDAVFVKRVEEVDQASLERGLGTPPKR